MVGRDRRLAVLVLLGGWAAAASSPCHFAGELAASAAAADAAAATATVDAVPTDGGAAAWGRWVGRYSEFHERVVDGRCAPRFLVFEVAGVKGLGNQVMALSAALLAAMLSDRAFVIRWATPVPLTDYLVPTVFNWDAEEVLPHLPGPVIADAVYLSTGAGLEKSASSVRLLPLSLRVRDAADRWWAARRRGGMRGPAHLASPSSACHPLAPASLPDVLAALLRGRPGRQPSRRSCRARAAAPPAHRPPELLRSPSARCEHDLSALRGVC